MTTTTGSYQHWDAAPPAFPRIPELAPQAAGESVEQYGLRALAFVVAEDVTVTLPDEALRLAHYVFPLCVAGGRALAPRVAERLARAQSLVTGEITRRARRAEREAAAAEVLAAGAPKTGDRPNAGPMAPLAPTPGPQAPPQAALQAPTAPAGVSTPPAPVAPVRAAQPVGGASLTTAAAQVARQAMQAARPVAPAPRPVAPAARPVTRAAAPVADEWGF